MAALEVIALDTATPQLRAPGTGDTYSAPRAIAITPETLTGSASTSGLSVTQTWNTTGTPTALSVSVTDTASNAASLLADFKVGGSSKANIQKDGQINGVYLFATGGIIYENTNGFRTDGTGCYVGSNKFIGWRSGASSGSVDTALVRVAAKIVKVTDGSSGAGVIVTPSQIVAALPSAAAAGAGARSFVTDATATTFLSTVAGGGANKVPVVSNGTNWLIG